MEDNNALGLAILALGKAGSGGGGGGGSVAIDDKTIVKNQSNQLMTSIGGSVKHVQDVTNYISDNVYLDQNTWLVWHDSITYDALPVTNAPTWGNGSTYDLAVSFDYQGTTVNWSETNVTAAAKTDNSLIKFNSLSGDVVSIEIEAFNPSLTAFNTHIYPDTNTYSVSKNNISNVHLTILEHTNIAGDQVEKLNCKAIGVGGGLDRDTTNNNIIWTLGDRIRAGEGNFSTKIGERPGSGEVITATGTNALAHGTSANASGNNSVALSGSHSGGMFSTACSYATANGNYSFAAGQGSLASSNNQIAVGKYNLQDNNSTYAFIIGNGTSNNAQSNALTVDWNGNLVCNNIPAPPAADGTYNLSCTVSNGTVTYAWVAGGGGTLTPAEGVSF